MKIIIRNYLIIIGAVACLISGCSSIATKLSGENSWRDPSKLTEAMKKDKTLDRVIRDAFEGIGEDGVVDHHVHLVGLANHKNNYNGSIENKKVICEDNYKALNKEWIYLNNSRFEGFNLFRRVQTQVFLRSSGVKDTSRVEILNNKSHSQANEDSASRLYQLVKYFRADSDGTDNKHPGKFLLLAMDAYHEESGDINWEKTDIFISNDYVVELANCMNKMAEKDNLGAPFEPVISIHPYRTDAVQMLNHLKARADIKYVKWLPNTMNINPRSDKSQLFYKAMAKQGVTLMTHTGHEEATIAEDENQRFGNPLLFDRAAKTKVNIIMAHSGYRGINWTRQGSKANTTSFQKMLMDYPNISGGLSSTLTLHSKELTTSEVDAQQDAENVCRQPHAYYPNIDVYMNEDDCRLMNNLKWILDYSNDKNGWSHFVNGSDYPLPAVAFLNPTESLFRYGFINNHEKKALNELYKYNPLLFDFVMKRTIRHPIKPSHKLPVELFMRSTTM